MKLGTFVGSALMMGVAIACGGSTISNGDAGSDGAPAVDGDHCIGCTGCPTDPPAPSSACAYENQMCEYGSNPDPACNQEFVCTGSKWMDQTTGQVCAPQSQCPATYAAVPVMQPCTPNQLSCGYPEGECICTNSFGGLPMQMTEWDCFPAASGCPSPRPTIGSNCADVGIECGYGACSGGVELKCTNTGWQEEEVPCPG